ncbi:hypothetical protein TNCT_717401 [Trichonephila clavata]|uniref:Uncharacterized protein n=1 Tax=Trichonephila clavata TaxID=2740835 RepID=A0A8X6FD56_TRICU|nr:hypothetical protein TNCT_717401 [Trichonephila clavata]
MESRSSVLKGDRDVENEELITNFRNDVGSKTLVNHFVDRQDFTFEGYRSLNAIKDCVVALLPRRRVDRAVIDHVGECYIPPTTTAAQFCLRIIPGFVGVKWDKIQTGFV